jgi:pimeloyl-ACP methyl ester carboxylesterase
VPDDLKDPHAMPAPTTTQAEQDTANAGPVTRTVDDGIDTGGAGGDEEHKVTDANVVAGREWRRPLGSDPGGIDPDDMNDKMRAVDNAAPSQDDPVTPMGTGFSIGDVSANLARMYPKKTERVVASDPARLSQPPIQLARDHAETLTDDIATEVKGEDTEVLGEPVRGWGQITQGLHDARGTRVLDRSIINAARGARGRDGGDALHLPNADGAVNDLASSRGGFTGAQERDNLEKMPLRLERTPGQLSQTPFREGMEEDILGAK